MLLRLYGRFDHGFYAKIKIVEKTINVYVLVSLL